MLTIRPLASPLHEPARAAAVVAAIGTWLTTHGIAHRFAAAGEPAADLLLILTGGTEHLALEALAGNTEPAFLLAHPEQNSLPAALEIVSRLRQVGRRGRIALVSPHTDPAGLLAGLSAHLAVRRRLRASRLGRIGAPSDWLVASMPDPARVTDVWGPTVVDVPMDELREAVDRADPDAVAAERDAVLGAARAVVEPAPEDVSYAARVSVALCTLVERHRLDACAVRCFDLVLERRTTGCVGLSRLLDAGIVAGCEGDVPATLSMLWGQLTTGEPGFMANPQDLDARRGRVWLAHCTIASRLTRGHALRSHFESGLGVGIDGDVPPGDVTVVRIGGTDLRECFVADGQLVETDRVDQRCRTQVAVDLDAGAGSLLDAPVGNHHVVLRGRHAAALREYHETFVGGRP